MPARHLQKRQALVMARLSWATISGGVLGGANTPYQLKRSSFPSPNSLRVGISGSSRACPNTRPYGLHLDSTREQTLTNGSLCFHPGDRIGKANMVVIEAAGKRWRLEPAHDER